MKACGTAKQRKMIGSLLNKPAQEPQSKSGFLPGSMKAWIEDEMDLLESIKGERASLPDDCQVSFV